MAQKTGKRWKNAAEVLMDHEIWSFCTFIQRIALKKSLQSESLYLRTYKGFLEFVSKSNSGS
jgi:hypothetical protein